MKNLKKKEDLPPDIRPLIILIALGLLIVGCRNTPQVPNNPQVIFSSVALRDEEMGKVNQNSFVALSSPFIREKSLGSRVVTGYSSTVDQCDSTPFITANGERVRVGTIACPRYIPFGSVVVVDGKIYTCNDRMALKHAHRFDIWFPTRAEAIAWGKQIKEIIVLN